MITDDLVLYNIAVFREEIFEFLWINRCLMINIWRKKYKGKSLYECHSCNIPSVTAVGIPPTNIFFVFKSFDWDEPFGIVLLISTWEKRNKSLVSYLLLCQAYLNWIHQEIHTSLFYFCPAIFSIIYKIILKLKLNTYWFPIYDMFIFNYFINNRRISICDKPKSPRTTGHTIFHYNWINDLAISPKMFQKRSC